MTRTHSHQRDGLEIVDCACDDWPRPWYPRVELVRPRPPMRALALVAAMFSCSCVGDELVDACLDACDARLDATGCVDPVQMARHDRACRADCELAMPRRCVAAALDLWYCEAETPWRCRSGSSHPVPSVVCVDEDTSLAACLIEATP